ncbi:MAG: alpha/beta fold hydrolase [Candidatus Hodarchaeota archaeon]
MTELFAENINGIKICYEIYGEGYPVFLIHGFAAKKEYWIAQIGELSKKYKVIILDNRGSGKSDRPNISYTMEMLVEDLKGLMDFMKIEKAHFIGHSLGGAIIQHFTLKYPEYVNKIILMCSFPDLPLDEVGIQMYKENQIAIYKARLKDPIKSFYEKMKLRFSREFIKLMKEDPKRKFHGIFSANDLIESERIDPVTPQDINNLTNTLITHKILNRLHEIKNKALIIAGDKDKLASKAARDQLHEKIINSTLKVIPGSHWVNLEKAPDVNQIILDFL